MSAPLGMSAPILPLTKPLAKRALAEIRDIAQAYVGPLEILMK
ncbi:hypothetical protein [Sorangium sp. So ce1000]